MRLGLPLIVLSTSLAGLGCEAINDVGGGAGSGQKQTENGKFTVQFFTEPSTPTVGSTSFSIEVAGPDGKEGVSNADVVLSASLEGNSPSTHPATERGSGGYDVSDVNLHQEGTWIIVISVAKDGVSDSAEFVINVAADATPGS